LIIATDNTHTKYGKRENRRMITPESAILHNVKIKSFPLAGVQKMTICNKSIFREPGWELISDEKQEKPQNPEGESRADSIRRAKQRVFEIAMLNRFTHFITWTLDKDEIDRYDAKEVGKRLRKFLNNQTRRRDAKYIIIPEHHKDGAIHMHGLLSGAFQMADSHRKTTRGQTVYNMPDWKYGFSTAIELDGNVLAIARYITKYVTKDMTKIFGNFYYAGGKILREAETCLTDTEYGAVEAKEYGIEAFNVGFKYLDIDAPCNDYPDDYFDIAV
jgi:hypothetical protein